MKQDIFKIISVKWNPDENLAEEIVVEHIESGKKTMLVSGRIMKDLAFGVDGEMDWAGFTKLMSRMDETTYFDRSEWCSCPQNRKGAFGVIRCTVCKKPTLFNQTNL